MVTPLIQEPARAQYPRLVASCWVGGRWGRRFSKHCLEVADKVRERAPDLICRSPGTVGAWVGGAKS
eukprot:4222820-Alexandrium_andersonii.AAC.1